jgi:hypothetical protein
VLIALPSDATMGMRVSHPKLWRPWRRSDPRATPFRPPPHVPRAPRLAEHDDDAGREHSKLRLSLLTVGVTSSSYPLYLRYQLKPGLGHLKPRESLVRIESLCSHALAFAGIGPVLF